MTSTFYPPYHIGGADTLVKYFAEQLVKEGHEVHVLFSLDAFKYKRPYQKKKENYNGVIVHAIESTLGIAEPILNYSLYTQQATMKAFKNLVLKEKFDLVHHHNISLLGYNILKKIGEYKNVYTAHDYWLVCPKFDLYKFGNICEKRTCLTCVPLHGKPYPIYQLFPDFKSTINNNLDLIIAPSDYMTGRLKRELKLPVKTIWNFVAEPPKKLIRPDERNYFLFVGQLEKHKGIVQLVDAFKGQNQRLIILGKGSLEQTLKRKLTEEGMSNVVYKGWASSPSEVLGYMKYAKALILPSLWAENNPIVALEAYSVGTPVIGTMNGGIPDIIKLLDEKLLFDSKDFSELMQRIEFLERLKPNKNRIIKIFRDNFSFKAHKKKLKEAGYFDRV